MENPEKTPFTVKRALKHDAELYEADDTIDLDAHGDAALIEHLTASGTIAALEPVPFDPPAEDEGDDGGDNATEATEDTEAPVGDLAEAIGALDEADAALWLADGRPKVDALSKVLGSDVTGGMRDAAWAAFQEARHVAAGA